MQSASSLRTVALSSVNADVALDIMILLGQISLDLFKIRCNSMGSKARFRIQTASALKYHDVNVAR